MGVQKRMGEPYSLVVLEELLGAVDEGLVDEVLAHRLRKRGHVVEQILTGEGEGILGLREVVELAGLAGLVLDEDGLDTVHRRGGRSSLVPVLGRG